MSSYAPNPAATNCANRVFAFAIIIVLFASAPLSLRAQRRREATPSVTYPPQLLAELKQLQQAALKSDYAYRQLAHLTDSIGPRLTGTPELKEATSKSRGSSVSVALSEGVVSTYDTRDDAANLRLTRVVGFDAHRSARGAPGRLDHARQTEREHRRGSDL